MRRNLARWYDSLSVCDLPLLVVDVWERFFQCGSLWLFCLCHRGISLVFYCVSKWTILCSKYFQICSILGIVRQRICACYTSVVWLHTWRSECGLVETSCSRLTWAVLLWPVLLCRLLQCLEFLCCLHGRHDVVTGEWHHNFRLCLGWHAVVTTVWRDVCHPSVAWYLSLLCGIFVTIVWHICHCSVAWYLSPWCGLIFVTVVCHICHCSVAWYLSP